MKIAIIGSGVSGLVAAYLLAKNHEVVIYEKNYRIGGHAHTNYITENDTEIAVDNGFMVFNPKQYPNFIALLDMLKVKTVDTKMTFGVHIPNTVDFNGNFPNGIFAKRSNVFNLRYIKFLREIIRFRKAAKNYLRDNPKGKDSLGIFLRRHKFSSDLADWYLFPELSAIWSMKNPSQVSDFPALSTFKFLDNHQLLSNRQPQWKTIKGGSSVYIRKIRKYLEQHGSKILLNQNIKTVVRTQDSITVRSTSGARKYDYVIFATHADTTLSLLAEPTDAEHSALSSFTYTTNETVLHKDMSVLPKNKRVIGAWNYTQESSEDPSSAVFTYNMNILQHIPQQYPVLVTLNPSKEIPEELIYSRETYEHPKYTLGSLKGQSAIRNIQGDNRTLFVGAHLGYGFHEDGVVSAINALKHLGVKPLWKV